MRSDDIRAKGPSSLLMTYATVLYRLRHFGVIRSFNHPVGDVAEYWASQNLGLELAPKSKKGYDATDADGVRYQIKARWRATGRGTPTMDVRLSDPARFDALIAVVFDDDFNVDYAAILTVDVVRQRCRFVPNRNAYSMPFPRKTLSLVGVTDITERLQVFPPTEEEKRWMAVLAAVELKNATAAARP